MKLKNKKTGEIVDYNPTLERWNGPSKEIKHYVSLAELNAEWKDYEEPKNPYFINWFGEVSELLGYISDREIEKLKEVGNYFETKEEAEKAVEKLKALKRLKDEGFRFRWIDMQTGQIKYGLFLEKGQKFTRGDEDDLLLLFGGEE